MSDLGRIKDDEYASGLKQWDIYNFWKQGFGSLKLARQLVKWPLQQNMKFSSRDCEKVAEVISFAHTITIYVDRALDTFDNHDEMYKMEQSIVIRFCRLPSNI